VAAVIYLNALYNLLDRTEITGNPTIEESDLADPEDLAPMTSDPRATGGTTASFSEPSNGPDPDETSNGPGETEDPAETQPSATTPSSSETSPSQSETSTTQPSEPTGPTGPSQPTGPTQPPTFE